MEKLTEEQAIKECKELWEAIEQSGLSKLAFLDTSEGKVYWDKDYFANCPLCEYTEQKEPAAIGCADCPLVVKYGKACKALGYVGSDPSPVEFFSAVRGL